MELNLQTISMKLLNLEEKLQKKLPLMYKAEVEYNQKYFDLLLRSMGSSAPAREADAKTQLKEDPIFDLYHNLKLDVKILWSEKETLTTISSNLRSMTWQS